MARCGGGRVFWMQRAQGVAGAVAGERSGAAGRPLDGHWRVQHRCALHPPSQRQSDPAAHRRRCASCLPPRPQRPTPTSQGWTRPPPPACVHPPSRAPCANGETAHVPARRTTAAGEGARGGVAACPTMPALSAATRSGTGGGERPLPHATRGPCLRRQHGYGSHESTHVRLPTYKTATRAHAVALPTQTAATPPRTVPHRTHQRPPTPPHTPLHHATRRRRRGAGCVLWPERYV